MRQSACFLHVYDLIDARACATERKRERAVRSFRDFKLNSEKGIINTAF